MAGNLGLKELLANLVLLKDVRQSFLKNPEKFLSDNPDYKITKDQLEQLKAFDIAKWDSMKLSELDDWLVKASQISRPVSVSVGIPNVLKTMGYSFSQGTRRPRFFRGIDYASNKPHVQIIVTRSKR